MRKLLLICSVLAFGAAPAYAQDKPITPLAGSAGETLAIGPGCSGASAVTGRLVRVAGGSVILAVEDGKGAASAFMGAQLLLPVASNATGTGLAALQQGQEIQVDVTSCPNAEHTTMSMVAARIQPGTVASGTKTVAKKHVARAKKR